MKKLMIMALMLLSSTTLTFANGITTIGQPELETIQLNKIDLTDKQIIISGIEELDQINNNSRFKVKTLNVNGETIKAFIYTKTTEVKDISLIVLDGALQIGFIALFIFLILGKVFRYDVGRYVEGLVYVGFGYFILINFLR